MVTMNLRSFAHHTRTISIMDEFYLLIVRVLPRTRQKSK